MQIHKRFTADQLKVLLQGYRQGTLDRAAVEEILGIGKTRFFALLKEYRQDPAKLSLSYDRTSPCRLSASTEEQIRKELAVEKGLIDDPSLPIATYNYSAVKDRLGKHGIKVSLSTIVDRAKRTGCYQPHPKTKAHAREVVTTAIGSLIQHDASHHRWSPYAKDNWALITSLDDFSRKLLYADFVGQETSWAHINAAETVTRRHGLPLRYYVDSLRVFRFIQSRDSNWRKHTLQTDESDPQWRQVMRLLKDIFCLREHRTTDGYRKISLYNHEIELPNVPLREEVEIHMVPDPARGAIEIRIWWEHQMKRSVVYPLTEFPRVHF